MVTLLTVILTVISTVLWTVTIIGMYSFYKQGILWNILSYIVRRTLMPYAIVLMGTVDIFLFKMYGTVYGLNGLLLSAIVTALWLMWILFVVI